MNKTGPNKTPSKERILIVEDDPEVMKLYNALLTRNGYEVIEANYALPALFRVIHSPPDLVLADLDMPIMNGFELIAQFKSHLETRDIPVVVVTGSVSEASRAAAFKAGCAAYLTKPVDAKEFLAQVAELLPGRKRKQL